LQAEIASVVSLPAPALAGMTEEKLWNGREARMQVSTA